MINPKNKVYFLDWGYYIHASIYASHPIKPTVNFKKLPSTFVAMRMLLGDLRCTGIHPDDTVIIATDKTHISGNWRAKLDEEYKSTRKTKRETRSDINWHEEYRQHNNFEKSLDECTPFYILGIETLEADDIISYGVRYFSNNEKVIIATDQDYEQLMCFDKTYIFNPKIKRFKIVKNPYKILQKKIEKEVSDDLKRKVTNEKEFEVRRQIVDLTSLPKFIETKLQPVFLDLKDKEFNINLLPFKSIVSNFFNIYNNDSPQTFEKSKAYLERKEKKIIKEKERKKQLRFA